MLADEVEELVVQVSSGPTMYLFFPNNLPISTMPSTRASPRRRSSTLTPPPSPLDAQSLGIVAIRSSPLVGSNDPISNNIQLAGNPHVATPTRPAGTNQWAVISPRTSGSSNKNVGSSSGNFKDDKVGKTSLRRGEARTPAYILVCSHVGCMLIFQAKYGRRDGFRKVPADEACSRCR